MFLFFLSLLIVAFGQAAWFWPLGILSSLFGYALFWSTIIDEESWKMRFGLGTLWFTLVQLIQLSWLLSHPYGYIYVVHFLLSLAMGTQFGLVSILVTQERLKKPSHCLGIAGVWVLSEWLRLFFLAGMTFNPIGLALATTKYGLQTATLWGVFGMSFWVTLTNLFALRAWYFPVKRIRVAFVFLALFPYIFGFFHIIYQKRHAAKKEANVLLVQTNFPAEEALGHKSMQESLLYVFGEWVQILNLLQPHIEKKFDLIVLPEAVVPYGTYYAIYRQDEVAEAFEIFLGKKKLPPLHSHLAMKVSSNEGETVMVNNAYWAQSIANLFDAPVVLGLEDREKDQTYLSAFTFYPYAVQNIRYDKRVLLPMAEYIPFSFCRTLAAKYGVCGSFTHGERPCTIPTKKGQAGLSICYEETFGNIMRENKQIGANFLVNLTSDVWYPNSRLPIQHFEHSRLRTVETGMPLVRSCNTGVTGAIDSLGCNIKILQNEKGDVENISEALEVTVPIHNYKTLYTYTGDLPIVLLSVIFVFLLFL